MSVVEIILYVVIGSFVIWYVAKSIWEIKNPDKVKAKKEAKKAKKEAKKQKKEDQKNDDEY